MKGSIPIARKIVKGLSVSLPLFVCFRDFVGSPASVEGNSMTPTLNPKGRTNRDVVWVDRMSLCNHGVRRGDVVAAFSPEDPKERIVKRVIALEGDILKKRNTASTYVEIPKGHCWLEGDARSSHDSNTYGSVSLGLVYGRVTRIVVPLKRSSPVISALSQEQMDRLV